MFPQLLPAVAATVLALMAGGSFAGLSRRIAWWPLGIASIAVQLLLTSIPLTEVPWLAAAGHWVWAIAVAAVLVVLVRNWRIETGLRQLPWAVAGLGVGLNLLVIVSNGGYMPVSQSALDQTGQSAALAARTTFHREVILDEATRLPWLADIFADPTWAPPHPAVTSIGDRLLSLGLAGWAFLSVYAARSSKTPPGDRSSIQRSRASAATGLLAK
jgi:hypothetical protein